MHDHASRTALGARFDADRGRLIVPTQHGFVCYRGGDDADGQWVGAAEGTVKSAAEAERFLEGAFVALAHYNGR